MKATPLRVKLVAAMIGLLVLGLASVGTISVLLVQRHLLRSVDEQIEIVAQDSARTVLASSLSNGENVDRSAIAAAGQAELPSRFVFQKFTTAGVMQAQRPEPTGPGPKVPDDPSWLKAHENQAVTVPATVGEGSWRVYVAPVPGEGSIVVAMDLAEVADTVRLLALIEASAGGVVVLLLAGVGAAIVRSSLRPLNAMERTAAAIAAGDLTQRVPARDTRTEAGRLGQALNTMLGQIEQAFADRAASEERMRRFVADAGHELRTPLSVIRGFAERYRRGGRDDPSEVDRMVSHVEKTAIRMGGLVEGLLLLARLDAQRPLEKQPVDLLAVAGDAVTDLRLLAADRVLDISFTTDAAFIVEGDADRLRQVLGNLLANAIHHASPGTPVGVHLSTAGGMAKVEVADTGPGLTAEQAARVFERFYRADVARSRDSGGSGLGLSIVAAIVAAHGGQAGVESAPGQGSTFWFTVPLAT